MNEQQYHRMNEWEISRRNALLNLMKIFLILFQTALFLAVWFNFYQETMLHPYYYWGNWAMGGVFMVLYTLFARLYGGFQLNISRTSEIIYSLAISSIFTDFSMYCLSCLLSYRLVNPLPLLGTWAIGFGFSMLWARLAILLNDHLFPPKSTYIIYDNEDAFEAMSAVGKMAWKFEIAGTLNISDGLDKIFDTIQACDAVFLCGLHSSDRNTVLKFCIERNIQAYIRPKIGDILVSSATRLHLMNVPVLHCTRNNSSYWYRLSKRAMDIVISGIALIVASPFMLVTALAIRLYDGGPALYKQVRLTQNGKKFLILKFRSMRVDAEKDGVARLATENDDRITPVGHFIRKCRLDELPQLLNILRGDMSIVGPRPERPEISAQYEGEMPEFRLRLQVKAGLTGYAQVYGKYNTNPYDKLEMDLMYIANQSILQDLKLMFATVKILFMSESTEGIAEGKTTASRKDAPV